MSIFNEDDRNAVLNPEDLIGEGKKYSTQEDANKALAHSQVYIKQLESEQEELRAELAAQERVEEILKRVNQPAQNSSTPQEPVKEPVASPVNLDERIEETLNKRETIQRTKTNVEAVANRMIEVLGSTDKAKQYVEDKARELGVGVQFLQEVAARSPNAFYQTVGLNATATPTPGASKSDVNSMSFAGSNTVKPGTYAAYQELLATDRKAYFSPKIQQQMMSEALAKGDAFFN